MATLTSVEGNYTNDLNSNLQNIMTYYFLVASSVKCFRFKLIKHQFGPFVKSKTPKKIISDACARPFGKKLVSPRENRKAATFCTQSKTYSSVARINTIRVLCDSHF